MGVAALDGVELLFWGVAGFRGLAGPALTRRAPSVDLIQTYEPDAGNGNPPSGWRPRLCSARL